MKLLIQSNGNTKKFHPTIYCACDTCDTILGLKLIHVSKGGPKLIDWFNFKAALQVEFEFQTWLGELQNVKFYLAVLIDNTPALDGVMFWRCSCEKILHEPLTHTLYQ